MHRVLITFGVALLIALHAHVGATTPPNNPQYLPLVINPVPTPFPTATPTEGPSIAITSFTPDFGSSAGGTVITVYGSQFVPGQMRFVFDVRGTNPDATNVNCVSSRQCSITTPPGAGVVKVVAVNVTNREASEPALFTYTPDIVAISLTSGPVAGGQMLAIDGYGFVTTMNVTIKGVPATLLTCGDPHPVTTCFITTGASATPGIGDVVVTVGSQSDTLPNAYTYVP